VTLLGSLAWCFNFAAVGWALGDRWESHHHGVHYADYSAVAAVVLAASVLLSIRRRHDRRRP